MTNLDHYFRFRAAIGEIIDTRFHTLEWLDVEVQSSRARLWATEHSIIIATLKEYPTGALEVHGLVAAGDLAGILDLIPHAENWGRRVGAIVACIESRPGWAKALAGDGYEPYQLTLRKEL